MIYAGIPLDYPRIYCRLILSGVLYGKAKRGST